MPQFTYNFSDPAGSSFTVTTEDNTTVFTSPSGQQAEGFAITGISGTFNGQEITGLSGPAGFSQSDTDANGGGASGPFNNIIFINDTQAEFGTSSRGVDSNGIGFRTATTDYGVFTDGTEFRYQANGNPTPATLSSTNAPCFVTGTMIRTTRGEVAVEDLRVGDLAVTASGSVRPITWIGHREVASTSGSICFSHQPVRVRANAFGRGLPVRDLRLSPGHPVLVGADADNEGGYLVPVMCLINGTTIAREPVSSVTYWHVELECHDILLAEGLAAESYLDGGERAFFEEASDHALHNPDFVVPGWDARCRPVAVDGPVVEAERARLAGVFAGNLTADCAWEDAAHFPWLAA